MSGVNELPGPTPQHLAYLLHMAVRRLRREAEQDVPPPMSTLRAAQARLLDLVPAGGARASGLAAGMRVSKQGLGQLVAQLSDRGYVEVLPDPADRRARLVRCTELGRSAQQLMRARLAATEERWQDEVGEERYAVFRAVLAELVAGDPGAAAED